MVHITYGIIYTLLKALIDINQKPNILPSIGNRGRSVQKKFSIIFQNQLSGRFPTLLKVVNYFL